MSGGPSVPQAYQPTGQAQADQGFQSGAGQLAQAGSSLYNYVSPAYQQNYQSVVANPYAKTAQAGANQVAQLGQGIGTSLIGMGDTAASYAPSVMQTGFDPQGALYNRNLSATLDAQNASSAMNGVAGSPFAAGVAGQTAENFNIDWQNNQQQRQAQAIAQLGQLSTTAQGDYGAGLSTLQTSSALPSQTYLDQKQANIAALNAMTQGTVESLSPTQQSVSDYGQYLNIGQGATGLDQNAEKQQYTQQQNAMSQWGQGFGTVFSLFGL